VFDQTNKNMLKLEKQLVLSRSKPCSGDEDESGVVRILKFWKKLEDRWGNPGTNAKAVECKEMLLSLNRVSDEAAAIAEVGSRLCDRKKGLCCSSHSKKCVCLKGTTWQDGRCRLLAGQPCNRMNVRVPWETPCVRHADCLPNLDPTNEEPRVCRCQIGDAGAICPPPDAKNLEEVERINTNLKGHPHLDSDTESTSSPGMSHHGISPKSSNPVKVVVEEDPKTAFEHVTSSPPRSTQSSVSPSPKYTRPTGKPNKNMTIEDEIDTHELEAILVEIVSDRTVADDVPCDPDDDADFNTLAKRVSKSNRNHEPVPDPRGTLAQLHAFNERGTHFCDVQQLLICSHFDEECVCDGGLVWSPDENLCGIGPEKPCNLIVGMGTHGSEAERDIRKIFVLPQPKCIKGYTCQHSNANGSLLATCQAHRENTNTTASAALVSAQNYYSSYSFPCITLAVILLNALASCLL
jgi:hypothetical protein